MFPISGEDHAMKDAEDARTTAVLQDEPCPATLHELLVSDLRQLVIDGTLASGQRVGEAKLCARFGVSRTPLREALKVLAAEGFVQLRPNRGAVVAPVDINQITPIFEVKGALEHLIGVTAAERATADDLSAIAALHEELGQALNRRDLNAYTRLNFSFHKALVQTSRNAVLVETYDALQQKIWRYRFIVNDAFSRLQDSYAEHEEIMIALNARTPLDLAARLERHNRRTRDAMLRAASGDAQDPSSRAQG